MLSGAGKNIGSALTALAERKDTLNNLIAEGPFDAKSIASMLGGSGKDIGSSIDILVANRESFNALIAAGPFDAKSISCILNGASKNIGTGAQILKEKMPQLRMMIDIGFVDTQIATKLNLCSVTHLAAKIDAMTTQLQNELHRHTSIDLHAMGQVLAASPATVKTSTQGVA